MGLIEASTLHSSHPPCKGSFTKCATHLRSWYIDTPSELVYLDLARIDAALPKSQAVLPYPKAERIVQRILFDSSSKEHIPCKANLETLNATNIKSTVMPAMASKSMQRKQDVRHPGWFRHTMNPYSGLMLNQSNLNAALACPLPHSPETGTPPIWCRLQVRRPQPREFSGCKVWIV